VKRLFPFLILLFAGSATATDYTVQPGDNVNNKKFAPGDNVYYLHGYYPHQEIHGTGPIMVTGVGSSTVIASGNQWGGALDVYASNVTVQNLKCQNTRETGIYLHAANCTAQNCECTACGSGILLNASGCKALACNIHDTKMVVNTPGGNDDYGAIGILVQAANCEVANCNLTRCKAKSYDYGTDGGGIEFNGTVDGSSIHDNTVTDCDGFFEIGGGSARNVTVKNNTCSGNGSLCCLHTSGGFASKISNLQISGNTVTEPAPYHNPIIFGCSSLNGIVVLTGNTFTTPAKIFGNGNFVHTNNTYTSNPGYALGSGEAIKK
jgi:parallel beta-helix repeat protein